MLLSCTTFSISGISIDFVTDFKYFTLTRARNVTPHRTRSQMIRNNCQPSIDPIQNPLLAGIEVNSGSIRVLIEPHRMNRNE